MADKLPDYTFFGNALEPLDEDDIAQRRPVRIDEQVALDKQGRRRFHGAFTGGFSAGYFNSVGTEEGWTPSTFQSSRSEKARSYFQKPEDFMDDEDQGEFGIAPKVLRARGEYSEGRTRAVGSSLVGPIPGAQGRLGELLRPVRETVGARLLKRMGWKQGQGVGPRVSKKEKKLRRKHHGAEGHKIYGCEMGPLLVSTPPQSISDQVVLQSSAGESESSEDENVENLTFAPEDLPSFLVQPKTNTFGMGYTGLDRRPVLSGHINLFEPPTINASGKSKVGIRGQAFGVGAFEAEDEDIYGADDMSRYDFSLESSRERRKKRWDQKNEDALKKNRVGNVDCLPGFSRAKGQMTSVKFFPPPQLPLNFRPGHMPRQSRFSEAPAETPEQHKRQGLGRHDLTAAERAVLVGDAPPRTLNLAPAALPKEVKEETLSLEDDTPIIATPLPVGQFKPFTHDGDKQKRYQQFLTLSKQGCKDKLISLQPPTMTEWERSRERNEFEQAARLYQPLSGPISDRFVSSSTLLGHEEKPHVDKPQEEPSVSAAKLKMFGKLTRVKEAWQPCSLLCKRFNVPEPNSGAAVAPSRRKAMAGFSVFDFLDAAQKNVPLVEVDASQAVKDIIPEHSTPMDDVVAQKDTTPSAETMSAPVFQTNVLPVTGTLLAADLFPDITEKVDLYKAIFLSSSEDEGDEEVPPPPRPVREEKTEEPLPPPPAPSAKRNTMPPRGVFANIDLVSPLKPTEDPTTPIAELPPDTYGPLPPTLRTNVADNPTLVSAPLPLCFPSKHSKWVEKTKKEKKERSRSISKDRKKNKRESHSKSEARKRDSSKREARSLSKDSLTTMKSSKRKKNSSSKNKSKKHKKDKHKSKKKTKSSSSGSE